MILEEDGGITSDNNVEETHSQEDADRRSSLIRHISRHLKERQKLSRLHSRAEKQVVEIIRAKKQNDELLFTSDFGGGRKPLRRGNRKTSIGGLDEEEQEEDGSGSEVNWNRLMMLAKEEVEEQDRAAEMEELNFRLQLEEVKANAMEAEAAAKSAKEAFLKYQEAVVKKRTSAELPREVTERGKNIHEIFDKIQKVEEDLEKARAKLIRLQLKEEEALGPYQVNRPKRQTYVGKELINIQMEQEALSEELHFHEETLLKISYRKNISEELSRNIQQKKDALLFKIDRAQQDLESFKNENFRMEEKLKKKRQELKDRRYGRGFILPRVELASDKTLSSDLLSKSSEALHR